MKLLKRILPKQIKQALKETLRRAARYFGDRYNLIFWSQIEAEKKFFRPDPVIIKHILGGEKLVILDIGARGGMETEWEKYLPMLDVLLVEPEHEEAVKLREKGHKVVERLLGSEEGTRTFYLTERKAVSSVCEPAGPFLELYTSGNDKRFKLVDTTELPVTTVERIMQPMGGRVDYMKLDTQGSELEIIKGLGNVRPLFIKTEFSFLPFYKNSNIFFHLGQHLYDMGYLLFHMTYWGRSSPEKHLSDKPFSSTILPIHGDAWFCSDWTRDSGKAMILGREKQYEALMSVFGLKDIHGYAFSNKN